MENEQNPLLSVILDEKEIRWQYLIYEMIRSGKIDPWDVDISTFSLEYLKTLEKLKEMNFRVSGKVVLAAAILLKIKTNRLGLDEFLELISEDDLEEEISSELGNFSFIGDFFEDEDEEKIKKLAEQIKKENNLESFDLEPNLSRKKSRKVTVFELVSALRKAIDVDERREIKKREKLPAEKPPNFELEKVDVRAKIKDVYSSIVHFLKVQKSNTVEFRDIVPSNEIKDIIWTFIPLLHLAHEDKVLLSQSKPFGKILVEVKEKSLNFKKRK